MTNRFIILICMLFFALSLFGQRLKFEHYNDNNGLSHNSVRHVVQDKYGFLWVGTFSGLNRFDGYEFQSFLNTSDGNPKINDNDITALEIDHETGNIWIGTRKGLTLFNIETQEFTTFLNEKGNPKSLQDEEIRSVYIDNFKRIWVGTKDKGVFLFFAEERRFEKVEIAGFNYVKEIFEDTNGNIWIGSYGSASVAKIILDSVGKIQQIETFTLQIPNSTEVNPYVNFIYEDHKKDMFVGTRKGLYKLNTIKNEFENLYIENHVDRESLGPYFLTVARAPNGKYWVGTLGGLLVCDTLEAINKGLYKRYFSDLTDQTSLVDNLVSALYFDTSGILWIGTEDGLDKYDPFENQFNLNKDISHFIGNQAPRIRGFSKTYDEKLIVATRHNGLFVSKDEGFVPLEINQKDISSIYSIDGKTFFCGLWDGKILVYDYVNHKSKEIYVGFEESPIMAFENLGNGKIVIGSFGEGAVILDTEALSEESQKIQLIKGDEINEIIKGNDEILWFATENGVVKYNLVTGEKLVYRSSLNKDKGLLHNNVSDIIMDNSGKLWAATRHGLCFFNEAENQFSPLNIPEELAGKWITDLLMDSQGDLWLNVNNNSVARLKVNSLDYNIYHVNSGNRLDYFSSRGFYKVGKSNIYLGGKKGVIYFSPYTIEENKLSPNPFITEIKIQNEVLIPGKEINGEVPLEKDFNETNDITLNYKNRNFSLQFSTPSYANEKLNKFEYQLEGFDKTWVSTDSNSRTVQYTNLFPGKYVFKIKSCNSDGHWSDVVSYNIKIERPFWLSYQALALFVILLGLITYFVRREVKNRMQLRQELVTEKVNRERDIKLNNEKLRFFTNISHELRTPLTLILGPVKQLIEESKTYSSDYQKSRYNLIHQNASRLLNLVNQVLDFRKAQTGELKLKVSRTDILQYTHNTFDSFKEFAYNKEIQMNFNTENDTLFGWIDHDKLDKILYNLLSNAIKFTNKYGHVDLYVHFKDEKEEVVVLEVSDDGIGIPLKSQEKIFKRFYQATNSKENNTGSGIGLSLVKALVDLHKGHITVKSAPKKGSIFSVEIPIKREFYSKNEVFEFVANTNKELPTAPVSIKKTTTNTEIKEKILVVEDNVELRKYLIDYLSNYYKVYEAENGEEGLRICRQIKPILCVADVMMPVKNGLEFCEELKNDEFISHIPVILLTALSENEDKVNGYNMGADGYLVKPFDPSLLQSIIVNIIKSRLELKSKFSNDADSEIGLITHSPVDEALMRKISKLIEDHISKADLTTSFLYEELGMSSSKLYRKIKELTDLAPNEFIRTIRLKRAVQLLKTKKYNVSEVTDLVGFNDPLYFSRCFKKQFGYPPSKLLK